MQDTKYICDDGHVAEEASTTIIERPETYKVKGEPVTVLAKVRLCPICKNDISDEVLDDASLQLAYDSYRRNHKIIFPAEIRALRELYGLSQRGLGALLDWGPITIHRYETGSLPDESHNQVLRLLQDPFNMDRIVRENPEALDHETYRKIQDRLAVILNSKAPAKVAEVLGQSGRQKKASEFTGYIDFQPETLMEMMVFFAYKAGGVLKTKLNKLLWYADFTHYKYHTLSISGAAYSHYTYGPVPQNYEAFLTALCANDALLVDEVDLGTNAEGEAMTGIYLCAAREPILSDLSTTATLVLDEVHKHFASMGSKKISTLSHQEEAYIQTRYKELISYKYADLLKVDPLAKPKRRRKKAADTTRKTVEISPEILEALKAALKRSRPR